MNSPASSGSNGFHFSHFLMIDSATQPMELSTSKKYISPN